MGLLLRHKLLVGAAALVAAASAGGAYAATQSGSSPQQAFINDVAKRLHVSPTQLRSALKGALSDRLQALVKSGQLTQAQANRIVQQLEQGGRLPLFFLAPGARFGFHAHGLIGGPLHPVAGYLGLTEIQLLADLRSGQSLAHIAKARGKSVSGLERAIITAEKARLDRLVTAGMITKAQEQRLLNRLSARVARLVNRTGFGRLMMPEPPRLMPNDGPPLPPPVGVAPIPGPAPAA
jgi:AraC-like DNA-binding protein